MNGYDDGSSTILAIARSPQSKAQRLISAAILAMHWNMLALAAVMALAGLVVPPVPPWGAIVLVLVSLWSAISWGRLTLDRIIIDPHFTRSMVTAALWSGGSCLAISSTLLASLTEPTYGFASGLLVAGLLINMVGSPRAIPALAIPLPAARRNLIQIQAGIASLLLLAVFLGFIGDT